MKRLSLSILAIILLSTSALAQPAITFKEATYDFGSFLENDGKVTHDFIFVNTGDQPLVLSNVRSTCGCTVPQYTKEPIAPGDSGAIKVTYNPQGRPGKFNKPIYVNTNVSTERITLRIKGVVIREEKPQAENPYKIGELSLRSLHLPLFDTPKGQIKSGEIAIRNEGKSKLSNPTFKNVPAHITVEMLPPVLSPREEGVLKISYNPDLVDDWGFQREEFQLGFGDGSSTEGFNTITVSANLLDDFSKMTPSQRREAGHAQLSSDAVDFGVMSGSKILKQTFTITNTGSQPLLIRKISNDSRMLEVSCKKGEVKPGKSVKVTVCCDPSLSRSNLLNTRLMVITNDPDRPFVPVRVIGSFE